MLRITSLKKTHAADSARAAGGKFSLCIEDLRIERPGVYGLVGANGCGKSTLAKLICGILKPDAGRIETALGSRDITMVTQKPYIMDDTVFNNLAYPLRIRGAKNVRGLCDEQLEKIGFLGRKHQMARGLSGGEKQKLALLRAMVFGPRLIILDEAMTDLDLDSLDMFIGMILERQARSPAAWIVISHQIALVRRLCDRVFFMADGRLEAQGPAEELLRSRNPAVRRYLGANFLGGAGERPSIP